MNTTRTRTAKSWPRLLLGGIVVLFAAALVGPGSYQRWSVTAGQGKDDALDVQILVLPNASAKRAKRAAPDDVQLAIFSRGGFDALNVDPSTVTFAGAAVAMNGNGKYKVTVKDVDGDGLDDLVVIFARENLHVGPKPVKAEFQARTLDGKLIQGHECAQASGEPCGGGLISPPGTNKKLLKRSRKTPSQFELQAVVFSEAFDGVAAPALPAGWFTSFVNGAANCTPTGTCAQGNNWGTTTTFPSSAPNAAFHNDPTCVTDNFLVTPAISIASTAPILTFMNQYNLENTFDGTVLEISTDGGTTFADVTSVSIGGSFTQGGYNGTISVNFLSPILGRSAWTGLSGGTSAAPTYLTTIVNLGPNLAGKTINIRWRTASDCSLSATGANGQWVDAVSLDDQVCTLTCPADITTSNDPNQCGAVVTYSDPTQSGSCGTVSCTPPSGSFFPVGMTTVNCDASGTSANPDCSFTVTVNDTQPPSITCPASVTAVSAVACPPTSSTVVNYTTPTPTDNCPGVTVACNPPSGSPLPAGTTTVTCTATDASMNTAACSFSVTVFNGRLQDDSNPKNVLLFNTTTGAYILCCGGTVFTGTGSVILRGCTFTLQHNPSDRRLLVNVDFSQKKGTASLQFPPGVNKCTITDRNMADDTSTCP